GAVEVEAQPAAKAYRIGWLGTFPLDPQCAIGSAFTRGLREHGLPALMAELVSLRVSLIVTTGPSPSRADKGAPPTVPVLFVSVNDPVGLGLGTSLARPGRHITGFTGVEPDAFTAKQLQMPPPASPQSGKSRMISATRSLEDPFSLPARDNDRGGARQPGTT